MPAKKQITPEEMAKAPMSPRQLVFAKWLQEKTAYEVDYRTAALAFALLKDFRAKSPEIARLEAEERADRARQVKVERLERLIAQAKALELELDGGTEPAAIEEVGGEPVVEEEEAPEVKVAPAPKPKKAAKKKPVVSAVPDIPVESEPDDIDAPEGVPVEDEAQQVIAAEADEDFEDFVVDPDDDEDEF